MGTILVAFGSAIVGAFLRILIDREKAFSLKFEEQRTLRQMRIERNTAAHMQT